MSNIKLIPQNYFFIFSVFYISSINSSNELANQVCKNTSNFKFCEDTLYADPRAPKADRYVLAYIAFGGAYRNATSTSSFIESRIVNTTNNMEHGTIMLERFEKCLRYYREAVRVLEEALGNLDSETFFELGDFAEKPGNSARNCQVILKGSDGILAKRNQDLIRISQVCIAVSKLYDVSS